MAMNKLGLLQGVRRATVSPAIFRAAQLIRQCGAQVLSDCAELADGEAMARDAVIEKSDALIVCGGDGSILSVARCAAVHGVPVLGANFGQLGFLSEVDAAGLEQAVPRLVNGDFSIEKRLMLRAQWRDQQITALNDIVVRRESSLAVVRADVSVDGQLLDHYVADGILVSTPTGASAYALSCGGPIVHPQLECLSMTAICPHSLRARPVLLAPGQRIAVSVASRSLPAIICADGQDIIHMDAVEPVCIERAPLDAQLIRLGSRDFFSMVHAKLVDRTLR